MEYESIWSLFQGTVLSIYLEARIWILIKLKSRIQPSSNKVDLCPYPHLLQTTSQNVWPLFEARIRIRILIKLKCRIQIRINIKVISWICVRIRIKGTSWIRIRIYLQMTSKNVWNMSLIEHLFMVFWAFI
jgi:hypothetical protein